ncbi:MAG: apolipoprotein N-acyltransferase [bacterium]|jgi:apolipoprotein N-acyltransferase
MARVAKISPWLLSTLSGALLLLAFPRADLESLAWVAFVPLLLILPQVSPGRGFLYGLVAGLAFYLGSISWVTHAMVLYGGLSCPLSLVALLAICLYLGSYFGLFSFLCCHFRLLSDWRGTWLLPALWVSLEFLRNYLLSGFPWNLLGYSQYQSPHFLQLASLTGVYGLSFLILLVNATLAYALLQSLRSRSVLKALLGAGIALALVLSYGHFRIHHLREGERIKVAVAQGNIDQSLKWNPARQRETLEIYKRLTREASRSRPAMIVWPETALPFYLRLEAKYRQEMQSLANETGSYLLVGSPDYEQEGREIRYFNSAFLLSPGKDSLERYDKIHLVPFGEYVPLRRFLPWVSKLVVGIGDFSAGQEARIFSLPAAKFGVTVCFEAIFPELARNYRARGADFLINITNDAWFGKTAAPYQHLAMATVRAVENGCYLVRAANTGISAVISPVGRIIQSSSLFTEDQFTADLSLSTNLTPYARYGDVFAQCCLLITLVLILGRLWPAWVRKRKTQGELRRR